MRGIWGVLVLFTLVMGGIYGGVFTVTEGAAIGAFGAFLFALGRRSLTWAVLAQVLVESARTTAMLFTILIGALIFANFVNFTSMPEDLKNYVEQFQLHPDDRDRHDLRDLRAARHRDGRVVDDPADRAGAVPAGRAPRASIRSGSASWSWWWWRSA